MVRAESETAKSAIDDSWFRIDSPKFSILRRPDHCPGPSSGLDFVYLALVSPWKLAILQSSSLISQVLLVQSLFLPL